jgi:hypothetical protein
MSHYSKIFSSAPVNATAAKVASRSGVQWSPEKDLDKPWQVRSDAPLPTRPFRGPPENDMTGDRKGRLTIIGQSHTARCSNGKGSAWVVRCTCGYYEIRRIQTWKKLPPERAMCTHCDYLEEMKRGNTVPNHMKAVRNHV